MAIKYTSATTVQNPAHRFWNTKIQFAEHSVEQGVKIID